MSFANVSDAIPTVPSFDRAWYAFGIPYPSLTVPGAVSINVTATYACNCRFDSSTSCGDNTAKDITLENTTSNLALYQDATLGAVSKISISKGNRSSIADALGDFNGAQDGVGISFGDHCKSANGMPLLIRMIPGILPSGGGYEANKSGPYACCYKAPPPPQPSDS